MALSPLCICQSCKRSLVGCYLWRFIDTNDYFGCPSYDPFVVDIPESEVVLDVESVPEGFEPIVSIDIDDLPF